MQIGISGFALYFPPYRVRLEDWCNWTNSNYEKVNAIVGSSFRMCGANENAYTMAATAVVRLIEQYQIRPEDVGFLALGTESSTDSSAGAIIVHGMIDEALQTLGYGKLSHNCEVPEVKHACLGGIYALKSACRYLSFDEMSRVAIVVCSDIAEYEMGSSGEQTQGAGAVAMLVTREPHLVALDLTLSGSASTYRTADFRKPITRYANQKPSVYGQLVDHPVFNGKYSTECYLDTLRTALADMFNRKCSLERSSFRPHVYLRSLAALYLHKPYTRMSEMGACLCYLLSLARGDMSGQEELAEYCELAGVSVRGTIAELLQPPKLGKPSLDQTIQVIRSSTSDIIPRKVNAQYGMNRVREIGNLYTASLPAWMAAGFDEQSNNSSADWVDTEMLAFGYGSGDAGECIPMRVSHDWQDAASKIEFAEATRNHHIVSEDEYKVLHRREKLEGLEICQSGVFYIDHIGTRLAEPYNIGIEYYRHQI